MDLNSPLFDRIRVRKPAAEPQPQQVRACDHPGCETAAAHRAPKGRGKEGQYWHFCLEHVRAYNHSYNYFAGMDDDAVMQHQKADAVGHRPTWTMGVKAGSRTNWRRGDGAHASFDPFNLFGQSASAAHAAAEERKPRLSVSAVKALETLGLEEGADATAIKARYKALVKRFHPDANGGDRSYETRFQEIVRAYGVLRSLNLC